MTGRDEARAVAEEPRLDGWDHDGGDAPRREPRQAVVVIHGIGDQAPMRTLRAFTHGLGFRRLFSSPDRVAGTDDLRRLTEAPTPQLRARTDFYEFYWGHHAPRGGFVSTVVWAVRLLLRREWRSRHGHVAAVVLGIQAAVVLTAVAALIGLGALVWATWHGRPVLVGAWSTVGAVLAALLAAHLLVSGFVRRVLADAVRYLQPRPENIEARRAIRAEGLTLLRRLHTSGDYDRVVVVGHSLGAVIGYDLLRSLWDEARHPDPRLAGEQSALDAFDAVADRLDPPAGSPRIPPQESEPAPADVEAFRVAQFALWQAGRADGIPWLVTDFVTVGAPLTYASLLFADPPLPLQGWPGLSLADKQALKEYPRCPPIHDEVEAGRFYTREYALPSTLRTLRVGHTAGVFGPTRWTNLYVPSRHVVLGDLLAGAVAPEFGPGVLDVPVHIEGRGPVAVLRRFFPVSHLSYWWAPNGGTARPDDRASGGEDATPPGTTAALASALRLGDILRVAVRPGLSPRRSGVGDVRASDPSRTVK